MSSYLPPVYNLNISRKLEPLIYIGVMLSLLVIFLSKDDIKTIGENNYQQNVLVTSAQQTPEQAVSILVNRLPSTLVQKIKLSELYSPSLKNSPAQDASRYNITVDKNENLVANSFSAGLNFKFLEQRLVVTNNSGSTHFSMSLDSYGYQGSLQLLKPVKAQYYKNVVYYNRDPNLIEWYANTEEGLEQFFTILARPSGLTEKNIGLLEVNLSIAGNVISELRNGILSINNLNGDSSYFYKNLVVFDANGARLTARFELHDRQLRIVVDTLSAVFPITIDPLFSKVSELSANTPIGSDDFGFSIDIDGETAVVSALGADFLDPNVPQVMLKDAGLVYVFTRDNNNDWILKQKLFAVNPGPINGGLFGYDVALSGDTIMVKVPMNEVVAASAGLISGDVVYVFSRTNGVWTQTQLLNDLGLNGFRGSKTSMAIDGNTAVIASSDKAFVYIKSASVDGNPGVWKQKAMLSAVVGTKADGFGASVAIKGDTIVVGAPLEDFAMPGLQSDLIDSGAVYVFTMAPEATWTSKTETIKLFAMKYDAISQAIVRDVAAGDQFGGAVAFDGSTILVGVELADVNDTADAGAVYFYTGNGANWSFLSKHTTANAPGFGASVAINASEAIIGAPAGPSARGVLYYYNKIDSDWSQLKIIVQVAPLLPMPPVYDFGRYIAMSGSTVIASGVGLAKIYETSIDLSIVKTDDTVTGFIEPSVSFNYELTVTNNDSLLTANNVVVTDVLPLGVTGLRSTECVTIPATTTTYSCNLGDLVPGQSAKAFIDVSVTDLGTVTNTASVIAKQGDTNLVNNSDTLKTTINSVPTAIGQNLTVVQDSFIDIILSGTDPDQDVLAFEVLSKPSNGIVVQNEVTYRYIPGDGYAGSDFFTFVARDAHQDSPPATISITVTLSPREPTPGDDSYAVDEGAQLNIVAPGLLGNDIDPNGETFSLDVLSVTTPSNGVVTVAVDGSFVYTHDGSETTSDSFQYQITNNSGLKGTATVTLNVTLINEAPLASNQSYTVKEGERFTEIVPGLLSNASDTDLGDVLTVVGVVANKGPSNGSVTVNTDGSFVYTHDGSETTSDSFDFEIKDVASLKSIATATFTITPANDAPVANGDNYTVSEGAMLTESAPGLLQNDTDAEQSMLVVSTTLVVLPENGSAVLETDGSFIYTHNGSETISDSFDYQISDGLRNAVATVSITVLPMNTKPVASDSTETTDEDVSFDAQLIGSDPEDVTISYAVVAQPSKGNVLLNSNTGSYTYTPIQDKNGDDVFTFSVNDGVQDSANASVTISIDPINDTPSASNNTLDVVEELVANGVLAASDVDGDSLDYTMTTLPIKGTISDFDVNTGAYTYTPGLNNSGADSFNFTASDGVKTSTAATISITIAPAPDAPVAGAATFITKEDVTLVRQLVANDPDGDTLTYSVDALPTKGSLSVNSSTGMFTYIPTANYHGEDSFSFYASDNSTDSAIAIVKITIAPINDIPTASESDLAVVEDIETYGQLVATDIDGDSLNYIIVNQPSKGTVIINNTITGDFLYSPGRDQTGDDSFTFKTKDAKQFSNEARVSINIANQNDAPIATEQSVNLAEDASLSISLSGSDVDNDTLTFSISVPPRRGVLSGDLPNMVYTPNADVDGVDSFIFSVTDSNDATDNASISIRIRSVNDAPKAVSGILKVQQEQSSSSKLNGNDIESDTLIYSIVNQPLKGTLDLSPNGQYVYEPNEGEFGRDEFYFQVSDGSLDSDVASVFVHINATGNSAPSKPVLASPLLGQAVDPASVTLVWNKSSDVDGDPLRYQIQYCETENFEKCSPIDVAPILSTYLNIGGSAIGILMFGLLGSNRGRRLRQVLAMLVFIVILNACSDAADQATPTDKILDTQLSYIATDLTPASTYYWKIEVDDSLGGVSESNVGVFTTK